MIPALWSVFIQSLRPLTRLQPQDINYTSTPSPSLPTQYGTHHQLYRIDGELVAMSVLDILPNCVSGVYFMYSNKWEHCQLGKLSVLREAALAREIQAAGLASMKWVYLGERTICIPGRMLTTQGSTSTRARR